jgi:hypothetical protein
MTRMYDWYKSHHICTRCRRETAVPGRILCPDCAAKSRIKAAERRAVKRDEINRKQREWNIRKKEQGLCRCGRPARPGKVQCLECALRDNRRKTERQHANTQVMPLGLRKELHICLRCLKPAVAGYCYCEEHLAKQREYMSKAIAAGHKSTEVAAVRR